MPNDANDTKQHCHFILVHGACHGAWTWYKVKPRLTSVGHRVTTVDLAASGINGKRIEEVQSFEEYTQPLLEVLESLPDDDEKVILVGHSLGGLSVALAAEKFPEKVSVAVFVAAFMPDTIHQPSFVLEQHRQRIPADDLMDTEFSPYGTSQQNLMSMLFGPNFLSFKLYQLSPVEDLELARVLVRSGSLFLGDLSKASKFTEKGFGSVKRVYVICEEDQAILQQIQRWMIENNPVHEVFEIKDADHMPMLSKPQELCHCLLNIAHNYHKINSQNKCDLGD